MGIERGGDEFDLGIGIEIDKCDNRCRFNVFNAGEETPGDVVHCVSARTHVIAPLHSPVVEIHSLQERGNYFAQLGEHEVRVRTSFGQWVRAHAKQQHFVALARAVNADIRKRRCRK